MSRVLRIHHVAFAHDGEAAPQDRFADLLGMPVCHSEDVEGAFVERMIPAGDGFIQTLEATGAGVVERFVHKRGNALHHVALEVDDLDAMLRELRTRGVRLIDEVARPGGMGTRIAFIHPTEFRGLLMELVESPGEPGMIAGLVPHHHDPSIRGERHGRVFGAAVRHNLRGFRRTAALAGWDVDRLVPLVRDQAAGLPEEAAELTAIADGAGVDRDALLVYALTAHLIDPEECTVAAAVGTASASGATVILKNSDKIGADQLVGDGFHRHKEINVVVDLRPANGTRILGVAAAGSTGIKMGVNNAGIAAASNIVRTTELRNMKPDLDDLRALDRGRILREALSHRAAGAAADWALDALAEKPMATPGNLHFAGPDRMAIIEGSYDRLAMEWVRDRIAVRSNRFVLLDELNDPEDLSSPARQSRAEQMLAPHLGGVTVEHLVEVSRDHGNGPGPNSICRHSDDHRDETSLSAMIAALDPAGPATVSFALGKPCWAWSSPGGRLRMTTAGEGIPGMFADGSAWIGLYKEEPNQG